MTLLFAFPSHTTNVNARRRMLDLSYHVIRVSEVEEDGDRGEFGVDNDDALKSSASSFLSEAKDQQMVHKTVLGEMERWGGGHKEVEIIGDRKKDADSTKGGEGGFVYHPPGDDRVMW